MDDNHVILIGGNQAKTLILDTSNYNIMEVGPRMEEERVWLSCGSFKNAGDNTNYVIAAGGIGRKGPLKSTVLWDTTSNSGWVQGKRAQSYTSLMADLHQAINRVSSFSRCLNRTFPLRNCSFKTLVY